ncbi:MAG: putative repeat protein (TIGR03806 family) [Candidatus Omnitrophota bacterium]|jgi:uncharacterized repeat protein (TIGR03806 family)
MIYQQLLRLSTLIFLTSCTLHAQTPGSIRRDVWSGVSGTAINNLTNLATYPDTPSSTSMLTSFEGPTDVADNYGSRIVGYLHPNTTGEYIFWIAGDDNCELWLSTDPTPDRRQRIAAVPGWTNSRDWSKFTEQQSSPITLEAGRYYFIEALMKEGAGGDNLAVAWQVPGGSGQTVIPGSRLSPPEPLPPFTNADTTTLQVGTQVLLQVLRNDGDPNGYADLNLSTLTIESPPTLGTAVVDTLGGRILYMHTGGNPGQDGFTYTIADQGGLTSTPAQVTLDIVEGPRLANNTLTLPVTLPPSEYGVVDGFNGLTFADPLALRSPPGSTNELYVVEKAGRIQRIANLRAPTKTVFLDISGPVINSGEEGLLSMAFHPGYASNGYFYVFYTLNVGGLRQDRVSRFTVSANPALADAASELVLFDQRDEDSNHNGGDMHFGPDDYLYISLGDEGAANDTRNNSQRIDKDFFSGIIRIDVDRLPENLEPNGHASVTINPGTGKANYKVPADNPWVGAIRFNGLAVNSNLVVTEFYAVGLRNPWRMSFDPLNGDLWVGDVGQGAREEVDKITKGGNYGWGFREGFIVGPKATPAGANAIDPVWDYNRGLGISITGGVVSRGSNLPGLYGEYVVADYQTGNIWALREANEGITDRIIAQEAGVAGFGYDPSNGDILLCDIGNDRIWRLVESLPADAVTYPLTLSETGAFADLTNLDPNPGIFPYELNLPFWSDHALKRRWFSVPASNELIHYDADEPWQAQEGTIWIKHFDLPLERGNPASAVRVETRFLVRTANGVYGLSYAWNPAGDEASLVANPGTNIVFAINDGGAMTNQVWSIPTRTQCVVCHTPAGGWSLGFNTRQLNCEAIMAGSVTNQLAALSDAGFFQQPVEAPELLPRFAVSDDITQSLEYRVRSYLAVNCAQCHQAGGSSQAEFDVRAPLTLFETGLINGDVQQGSGDPADRLVIPGDPTHSTLLHRLKAPIGAGRMPPLATNVQDKKAIQLITDWIRSEATNHLSYVEWALQRFGPDPGPDAEPGANPDGDSGNNYYEFLTRTDPMVFTPPWKIDLTRDGSNAAIHFLRQPNTGFQVETSPDLIQWTPWNVPANRPIISGGAAFMDAIEGPADNSFLHYFRMRIYER